MLGVGALAWAFVGEVTVTQRKSILQLESQLNLQVWRNRTGQLTWLAIVFNLFVGGTELEVAFKLLAERLVLAFEPC